MKNDIGETIAEGDCPACITIADGIAAGWIGPLDDELRCQLSRGHAGAHQRLVEWDDAERSYGWQKRAAERAA